MQSVILLAIVAAASAATMMNLNLEHSFTGFKTTFARQYKSAAEETTRMAIFNKNVEYITKHNARVGVTYKLGVNQFADLTNAEYQAIYLRPFNLTRKMNAVQQAPNANPSSVDWRAKGKVTPIKDQGQCGSCWAFSTVAGVEGALVTAGKALVSLSEQNLVDCSQKQGNQGCNGGLMDDGFQYIIDNKGIDTEASYPYTARDGNCKFKAANVGATISKFTDVTAGSEAALETASATVGPLSVAIDASHNSFQLYHSGIYNEPQCSSKNLDHGVTAVGYDNTGNVHYWIVKNSWGTSWGEKGYIQMTKDKRNQCGIATAASYPTA